MTDRELLEKAAKAAGIELAWGGPDGDMARRKDTWDNWNPLFNDSDALRLAVKLNLKLECMVGQTAARTFDNRCAGCVDHADTQHYPKRDFNPDPYAATRRAIVLAAAEMGETP